MTVTRFIPRYRASADLAEVLALAPAPAPEAGDFAVTSACDGLWLALRASGAIGTVVVPAYTCERVVRAVLAAGCTPRFADVDPASGVMGAAQAQAALRAGPVAVVATHIFGATCDVAALRALAPRGCLIIEDCALAQGTRWHGVEVGAAGDVALFSFGLGKTVQIGWGGLARVNRPDLRASFAKEGGAAVGPGLSRATALVRTLAGADPLAAARLRAVGLARSVLRREHESRPDVARPFRHEPLAPGAAALLQRLRGRPRVAAQLEQRRVNTRRYAGRLAGSRLRALAAETGGEPCGPAFAVRCTDRAALARELRRSGIDCVRYFAYSAARLFGDSGCPESERLAAEVLGLPNHHGLDAGAVDHVAACALRAAG